MKRKSAAVLTFALSTVFWGAWACNSNTWEHQTFATLAATKATVDQASADYNSGKLPQTVAVRDLIQNARNAQTAAVKAFEAYSVAKTGGVATTAEVAKLQQAVVDAIAAVNVLIGDIKKVSTKTAASFLSLDQIMEPTAQRVYVFPKLKTFLQKNMRGA